MFEDIKMRLTRWHFNRFIKSAEHGWLLIQRGRNYQLYPMERDNDADAYVIETEDGKEYYEDNMGMMRTLNGHPFGIATERGRPIVDAETAQTAAAMDNKDDEEQRLSPETAIKVSDIQDHMTVGTLVPDDAERKIAIINPFHLTDDEPDIVDVRPTARLFRRAARPDTPRKAAKNAVEAERASQGLDLGTVGQTAMILMSAFIGGILTYIGTTAGGGGGGGIALPIMLSIL